MDGRNTQPRRSTNTTETMFWPRLSPDRRALVRSQSGPLASVPFTALPVHRVSKMDSEPYRVLLLRRLRLPLPFTVRTCRCGRPLDVFGHHRAACSTVGVLGRRGFAAENAIAQICREGGPGCPRTLCSETSHPTEATHDRLEVIAEGLTLFGGSQLATDATVVSPLHADGTHRRKADTTDGQALAEAHKHKERTCRGNGRARLVVIAVEVGGRWPQETKDFLWCKGCLCSQATGAHEQHGTDVGIVFWLVPRQSRSLHLCWV